MPDSTGPLQEPMFPPTSSDKSRPLFGTRFLLKVVSTTMLTWTASRMRPGVFADPLGWHTFFLHFLRGPVILAATGCHGRPGRRCLVQHGTSNQRSGVATPLPLLLLWRDLPLCAVLEEHQSLPSFSFFVPLLSVLPFFFISFLLQSWYFDHSSPFHSLCFSNLDMPEILLFGSTHL